jgi:plastocyanin
MVALTVAACSGSSSSNTVATSAPPATAAGASSSAPAAASGPTITVQGFAFGAPLTVKPGAEVKVVNRDGTEHTVTSDDGTSFDLSVSGDGGSATFKAPSKVGTYKFHCSIHPNMLGTLVVAG